MILKNDKIFSPNMQYRSMCNFPGICEANQWVEWKNSKMITQSYQKHFNESTNDLNSFN